IQQVNVNRSRTGFTLIELLVVIAIIAILVGMLGVAIAPWFTGQQQRNTKALVKKLHLELAEVYNEAMKTFRATTPPDSIYDSFGLVRGRDTAIARVIWIKLQLKATFPMTYSEALAPWGGYTDLQGILPARIHFVKALGNRQGANDPLTESSA